MWPNPDLVVFTEEIFNGKLHFLYSFGHALIQVKNKDTRLIYLSKVNNRNIRAMREICSKLKIKKPDQISHIVCGILAGE